MRVQPQYNAGRGKYIKDACKAIWHRATNLVYYVGGVSLGISLSILGTRGCNNLLNNQTIDKATYHTESQATGINGHVEYTRYLDGSQDVKIYPGLSHRLLGSELHQDFDGDGLIDRIRQDGPELKMHRLKICSFLWRKC